MIKIIVLAILISIILIILANYIYRVYYTNIDTIRVKLSGVYIGDKCGNSNFYEELEVREDGSFIFIRDDKEKKIKGMIELHRKLLIDDIVFSLDLYKKIKIYGSVLNNGTSLHLNFEEENMCGVYVKQKTNQKEKKCPQHQN